MVGVGDLPAVQLLQMVFAPPALSPEYVPGVQLVHSEAPAGAQVPAVHASSSPPLQKYPAELVASPIPSRDYITVEGITSCAVAADPICP
jgi:hypothetical protein